jgi:hypothetical protein
MIFAAITAIGLFGASFSPIHTSHPRASPSIMATQPFTPITQERDMGSYWQTEPGIAV